MVKVDMFTLHLILLEEYLMEDHLLELKQAKTKLLDGIEVRTDP